MIKIMTLDYAILMSMKPKFGGLLKVEDDQGKSDENNPINNNYEESEKEKRKFRRRFLKPQKKINLKTIMKLQLKIGIL